MSEIFKHVLTDTESNIESGDWKVDGKNIDGSKGSWSVEQTVLHGGRQEGSKLLKIKTEKLNLTLIPTRGMGIQSAEADDLKLRWDSPINEVVHPSFINLESRNGLGWLEGFNEWMCRCGLEFSGHPGVDEFTNNVGDKDSMMLTLHGKVANIPCSYVEVVVERAAEDLQVIIRSKVQERVFHGPKLELWSEVVVHIGQTRFSLHDTVTNRGGVPQEHQMLYHCNFGSPLLEEGAKLVAPVAENTPFNARAAEGISTYDTFVGPTPGFVEQVYKMRLKADAAGKTGVLLHNRAADRGASMHFDTSELPFFTLWKYSAAKPDGYVTGLEPGTCFPHNRKREREEGRVIVLQPGESRSYGLEVQLHPSATDVQAAADTIQKLV